VLASASALLLETVSELALHEIPEKDR